MWFIFDWLGIALGVLTWALLAFTDWVVVQYIFGAWFTTTRPRLSWLPYTDIGCLIFVLYQLLIFLSWLSHFMAVFTDPGTIRGIVPPAHFQNPKVCTLCADAWKPPRAHHCKTCQRCIFRMDHHCPWINNCVGLSNQKLFVLFLCYTATAAVATLVLLMCSAGYWLWNQRSWTEAAPPGSMPMVCAGLVTVQCLAAILFVSDFLNEQIESIQTNSTLVETYQRTHGQVTTFSDHFKMVFGDRWWWWPIPFPTPRLPDFVEPVISDVDEVWRSSPQSRYDNDNLGIAGDEAEYSRGPGLANSAEGLRARHSFDPGVE